MTVGFRAGFAVCTAAVALIAADSPPLGDAGLTPLAAHSFSDPVPALGSEPAGLTSAPAGMAEPGPFEAIAPAALPAPAPQPALATTEPEPAPAAPAIDPAETRCLAVALYHEARGEGRDGKMAVAQVILNRLESGRFASSICGIIRQRGQFPGIMANWNPPANAMWRQAQDVARKAMEGAEHTEVGNALYFHATYVSPDWGRKTRVAQVGRHVFYR